MPKPGGWAFWTRWSGDLGREAAARPGMGWESESGDGRWWRTAGCRKPAWRDASPSLGRSGLVPGGGVRRERRVEWGNRGLFFPTPRSTYSVDAATRLGRRESRRADRAATPPWPMPPAPLGWCPSGDAPWALRAHGRWDAQRPVLKSVLDSAPRIRQRVVWRMGLMLAFRHGESYDSLR